MDKLRWSWEGWLGDSSLGVTRAFRLFFIQILSLCSPYPLFLYLEMLHNNSYSSMMMFHHVKGSPRAVFSLNLSKYLFTRFTSTSFLHLSLWQTIHIYRIKSHSGIIPNRHTRGPRTSSLSALHRRHPSREMLRNHGRREHRQHAQRDQKWPRRSAEMGRHVTEVVGAVAESRLGTTTVPADVIGVTFVFQHLQAVLQDLRASAVLLRDAGSCGITGAWLRGRQGRGKRTCVCRPMQSGRVKQGDEETKRKYINILRHIDT